MRILDTSSFSIFAITTKGKISFKNLRIDLSSFLSGVVPSSMAIAIKSTIILFIVHLEVFFFSSETPNDGSDVLSFPLWIFLLFAANNFLPFESAYGFNSFLGEILVWTRRSFLFWRLILSRVVFLLASFVSSTFILDVPDESPFSINSSI